MECKFIVGQQVVCIKDDWTSSVGRTPIHYGYLIVPRKGKVYTIAAIECFTVTAHTPGAHLQLKEIGDGWWNHGSFKPLQPLTLFEDMLKMSIHDNLSQAARKIDKFDKIRIKEDV